MTNAPWTLAVLSLFVGLSAVVRADPITYHPMLVLDSPVTGTITQPSYSGNVPQGAQFYSFHTSAGQTYHITGRRLTGDYDMAFWVYAGLSSSTEAIGSFDSIPGVLYADDELLPNLSGRYGDPYLKFAAPADGDYTVAVTNFASAGTGPFDFLLGVSSTAPADLELTPEDLLMQWYTGVQTTSNPAPVQTPEPSSLVLACLAGGVLLRSRRRCR